MTDISKRFAIKRFTSPRGGTYYGIWDIAVMKYVRNTSDTSQRRAMSTMNDWNQWWKNRIDAGEAHQQEHIPYWDYEKDLPYDG